MSFSTTKAIVLRSLPFKDRQRILTLFSEQFGILSMILKGISSKKHQLLCFGELFCEAEFTFIKKRSDLVIFSEAHLLNQHLELRTNLTFLQAASSLLQVIIRSQLPGKPDPDLYALLSTFLKQIPHFPTPNALLTCFYLKFLKHEGVFDPETLQEAPFSPNEASLLTGLLAKSKFSDLKNHSLSSELTQKTLQLLLAKTALH